MNHHHWPRAAVATVALGVLGLLASACGAAGSAAPKVTHHVKNGGTLNVAYVAGQWPGLDPATDALDAADATIMNAIYGELFEIGPHNTIVPVEAKSYAFSDGNRVATIKLRSGLVFSDGTPMTASIIASDIRRDLLPSNGCLCDSNFAALSSITTPNTTTLVLHLKQPFTGIIAAFPGEAPNWTYDSAALAKEGETAFAQKPIGAGPFEVQSNSASARLVLVRNPKYFASGEPHLNSLIFTSAPTDSAAYASLQSGQNQVVYLPSSIPVIQEAKANTSIKVVSPPAQFWEFEALNEGVAPFNNVKVREALYYATNSAAIISALYKGLYTPTESPDGPGQNYFEAKVPGYATYDLKKAKALVSSIKGGVSFTIMTTTNTQFWLQEVEALQTQWEAAGMHVAIDETSLQEMVSDTIKGHWQVIDSNWGGYLDPGLAIPIFFGEGETFSGVHDPEINQLVNAAESTTNTSVQKKDYYKLYQRIATQYDAPILYAKPFFTFVAKSVSGITSATPQIDWAQVSMS